MGQEFVMAILDCVQVILLHRLLPFAELVLVHATSLSIALASVRPVQKMVCECKKKKYIVKTNAII